MRFFALALVLAALLLATGFAQQPPEMKHLSMTTPQDWGIRISSGSMMREGAVLHLKGSVEIRTWAKNGSPYDEFLILHADAADYHFDTGAIEPSGKVSIQPHHK